jgi:hypothetical protein
VGQVLDSVADELWSQGAARIIPSRSKSLVKHQHLDLTLYGLPRDEMTRPDKLIDGPPSRTASSMHRGTGDQVALSLVS